MELLLPNLGLIVWTTLAFLIVFFLMSKFAWKPILKSIKERESFIEESLTKAKEAEKNMLSINEKSNALLKEAMTEKQKIISEANEIKNQIVAEAKQKAIEESNKLIAAAKSDLQKEQAKMYEEIKKDVAGLIVATAEKVVKEKLKSSKEQDSMIEKAIKELNFN